MLVFPLTMPDELRIESVVFSAPPIAQAAPSIERGGAVYNVDLGPAVWRGSWQSGNLKPREHGIVRGWLDALGATNAFWAYDAIRPFPLAHATGFAALGWNGLGTLIGVTSSRAVTITGVPAGLVISSGDYLAFDYGAGPSRALHRAVTGAVPAAGTIQIEVHPHVRIGWAAGAVVSFARAAAKMVVQPQSVSEDVRSTRIARISFTAVQSV